MRSVEDRADRMMRRRYDGWYDRSTFAWAGINLAIALRDTERALFSRWGPNVKPNWDAALRPIYIVGAVYMGLGVAALVALALGWVH